MAVQNRTSSRRVFRWEGGEVERIPVKVTLRDYRERLARVAEELYPILNQLHEKSYSLIHPGKIQGNFIAVEPVAIATEGVCDGNESIQKAA